MPNRTMNASSILDVVGQIVCQCGHLMPGRTMKAVSSLDVVGQIVCQRSRLMPGRTMKAVSNLNVAGRIVCQRGRFTPSRTINAVSSLNVAGRIVCQRGWLMPESSEGSHQRPERGRSDRLPAWSAHARVFGCVPSASHPAPPNNGFKPTASRARSLLF